MKIHRIDHIGINVNDLPAAKAFFLDFGLELMGEADMEGALLNQVVALDNVRTTIAMLQTSDGQTTIELVKYHSPADENGIPSHPVNSHGMNHICFAVEDIDALVAKLKSRGTATFSEIQNYENIYKLVYIHGPEGIILELAERLPNS